MYLYGLYLSKCHMMDGRLEVSLERLSMSSSHGSGRVVVWDVGVGLALEETSVCANLR
jgi:hypothetical protein